MIRPSISFSIHDDESLKKLRKINLPIQLGLFQFNIYKNLKDKLLIILDKNQIEINIVHLPIDILRHNYKQIMDLIEVFYLGFGCEKFVIHPNKGIHEFVQYFVDMEAPMKLCVENFQWRRKKPLRSPLEIDYMCHSYINEKIRMTFDTSHAEHIWFDHKIMSFIINSISIIHLSNRIGKQQHMPFNIQNGDLNLIKFVKQLKRQYKWSGDIVLEYMGDYSYKLTPNYYYLQELIK